MKSVSCVILNLGLSEKNGSKLNCTGYILLVLWAQKGGSIFLYLVPLLYIDGMQYSRSSKYWLDISVSVLSATRTSRWSRLIVVLHLSRIHVSLAIFTLDKGLLRQFKRIVKPEFTVGVLVEMLL